MSSGLSENELSNSNGIYSNNKGDMYTFEKKGESTEDKDDFSLFAALEMESYPFEHVTAMTNQGQKVP